ncbi:MAG: hypothetical protein MMC33_005041 [Icmadophila ericetorum]|nr:hypothetical protein [Icmadophila ericetorum]
MFLNYAAQFWGKHAREALPGTVKDFLLRFLGLKSNLWCLSTTLSYWSTELPKRKAVSAVHLVADSELVELLPYVFQSGFPADSKDSSGRTPLSSAASKGHLAVVKLLLERNDVDVDSKDNCGCTALRYAAESGYETVVKLLLERDVDINCKDNRGRTALIYAALEGHETVVKLLSERDDVNMDSKDKNGWTALIYAVRWGHETMVKLLLEWDDIDVNCLDAEGLTPIDLAEP